MKYCSKCGNELMDEAVICPKCGCAVPDQSRNTGYSSSVADAPNMGIAVLGFIFPLVGFIFYLSWKSQTPLKAGSAGKGALIGFIGKLFTCFIMIILAVIGNSL